MIGSLRVRLLAVALVLLAAGIVVSDLFVVGELRRHLVDRVDRQVASFGELMARIDPVMLKAADEVASRRLLGGVDLISDLSVTYVDAGGRVVATTRTGRVAPEVSDSPVSPAFSAVGPDGSAWRMMIVSRRDQGVVVVGASLVAVDEIVGRLRLICLVTGLVLLALLGVAGWLAIRAALRPLRMIEQTATAVAAGDLGPRIPVSGPPGSEVARLAGVLNEMLSQIERAFTARSESEARMRRFVADAGHELRTPLFGIAGSAELHLMGGAGGPEQVDRTMRRIDTEARRLTALVEDLLLLARLDEPAAGPLLHMAPMDLRTLAVDALDRLHSLDPARPVTLTGLSAPKPPGAPGIAGVPGTPPPVFSGPSTTAAAVPGPPAAAPVLGDESRLRQVVVNLVGNVHAHTPPDAPVRIGVGQDGGESVLEIADSGPGVPADQVELIFERFHRGESSRARGPGGGSAGLGLAIVRSLVVAHGGRVEVSRPAQGGAVFRVRLPGTGESTQGL
ncbi:HAMP domain-containing sensor histidine kinase [Actinoplanes sp. NPDC051851]|uniref:sensor histidine kinase n=1 Tax=Actinoplanes sp. NPDC051851 TaxID=3154753 RepID=UPI00344068DB